MLRSATIWRVGASYAIYGRRPLGTEIKSRGGQRYGKENRFVVKGREAGGDNSAWVLSIDGAAPGHIYAYIDEEVFREINAQLDKRADTSDVVIPHREGR